jgi:cobalt-precorrin 5A hydrolase
MERGAMIVAGFGFRAGTPVASLRAAFDLATADAPPPQALATAADKAAGLAPLAAELRLPVLPIAPEALAAAAPVTRSAASFATRGVSSVSEAAALAGAGAGAELVAPRAISPDRRATCAIAVGGLE